MKIESKRLNINLVNIAGGKEQNSAGVSGDKLQKDLLYINLYLFLVNVQMHLPRKQYWKEEGKIQVLYRESKLTRFVLNAFIIAQTLLIIASL